jgi:hypothetical protein
MKFSFEGGVGVTTHTTGEMIGTNDNGQCISMTTF